jgi:hypothetical protein
MHLFFTYGTGGLLGAVAAHALIVSVIIALVVAVIVGIVLYVLPPTRPYAGGRRGPRVPRPHPAAVALSAR